MARPRRMNAVAEIGHALQAFTQNLHYPWYAFALPRLDHGGRTQRQQTDHRVHLEPLCIAIRKPQHVVVEPVLLIPHTTWSGLVHGSGNPEKMLTEFSSHVLEVGVLSG